MSNFNAVSGGIVFALIILASLVFRESKYSKSLDFLQQEKVYRALVFVFFAAAAFIRVYRFGSVPGGFNQDGAMAAVDALALSNYGADRFGMSLPVHFTAWGYGQMSVLMSYLMVPFIKLFGLSAVTARLPALIASLAGMAALFSFVKGAFGKKQALVVLFLMAINPWHIMQSRWALDCNLFPHFIMISVYLLYKGLSKKLFLYLSMIGFALCMYAYGIAFYTIPLMLLALCLYLILKKLVRVRDALICAAVYLAFAWPIFAVMIINYFKLPTLRVLGFTMPYFSDSMRAKDLLFFSGNMPGQFAENISAFVRTVVLQRPDAPWNTIDAFGAMYFVSLPFILFGIYTQFFNKRHKSPGEVFLLIWFLTALFAGITVNSVNVNRINIIYYPLVILLGMGINALLERIDVKRVASAAVFGTYVVMFCMFSFSYFGNHNEILSRYFYDGFGDCVAYAENGDFDKIYITSNIQGPGWSHVSEIMTLFYAKTDARYYQSPDYKERYVYVDFWGQTDIYDEAAFIFKRGEEQYFSDSVFEVTMFKDYGVAVRK